MQTVDLKKEMKALYNPSAKEVSVVEVPGMTFLMADGTGDPNGSVEFQEITEALFSVSYTLKFLVREEAEVKYGVMPLEGLWWMDDMREFSLDNKAHWLYTLMMMQPAFVTPAQIERAMAKAGAKKELPALERLRVERYDEGLSAQILHIGPFADEGPTVARLHQFIHDSGHVAQGKHHEIYLSDIRRADPARWKTVIRQPMK